MLQYQYQPLAEGHFRLIKPLSTDPVMLELAHTSLAEAPAYTALSYTWGKQQCSQPITVEGSILPVTQNLHDALGRLLENVIRSGHYLWVDAICINQGDMEERSVQVRYMKEIYEQAHKIYVWLGWPSDREHAYLAVEKMRRFNSILHDAIKAQKNDPIAALTTISGDNKEIYDEDQKSETYKAWLGIIDLCNVPWWHRAWVFQEASVPEGEDKVFFFYGYNCVTWNWIAAAVAVAVHLGQIQQINTNIGHLTPAQTLLFFFLEREKAPQYFLDLLQAFRQSQSTDPRDKVYAPLVLAQDASPSTVPTDYRKPVVEVYTDVVRWCFTIEGHELDFLGYVVRCAGQYPDFTHEHVSELPSWVPDWTFRISITPLARTLTSTANRPDSALDEYLYHASKNLTLQAHIDEKRLYIHGSCIGSITQLSSTVEDPACGLIVKDWLPIGLRATDTYPSTGQPLHAALSVTLVADAAFDIADNPSRGNAMDWILYTQRPDRLTGQENGRKDRMTVAFNRATIGRRLCLTDNGYIGLVPASTEVGDKVAVLYGGAVLYILRHAVEQDSSEIESGFANCSTNICKCHATVAKNYVFVGEAYIHGLMDGAALHLISDDEELNTCIALI